MSLSPRFWLPVVLVLGTAACGDAEHLSGTNEHADDGSFEIIDLNLGESLIGLSVEQLKVPVNAATNAELNRSTVSLRLHLSQGQSASIAMRAEDPGLDCYLLIKELPGGQTIDSCDDQVFIASAGAEDALVSVTAKTDMDILVVAAGGSDMQTSGRFTIDSIVHSDPHVDLSATGPGLEAISKQLRQREPSVTEWLRRGALEEGADGMLVAVPSALADVPLRQRAQLNGVIAAVNHEREELFDEMIRRSGDASASREVVGRAVASIYQVIRDNP